MHACVCALLQGSHNSIGHHPRPLAPETNEDPAKKQTRTPKATNECFPPPLCTKIDTSASHKKHVSPIADMISDSLLAVSLTLLLRLPQRHSQACRLELPRELRACL